MSPWDRLPPCGSGPDTGGRNARPAAPDRRSVGARRRIGRLDRSRRAGALGAPARATVQAPVDAKTGSRVTMQPIAAVSSVFGEITVFKNPTNGTVLYAQGDCFQSEADADGVSLAPYIHALYGLVLQAQARRVLMIGCGGGTLATLLMRSGIDVTIVDIDRSAFDVARRYFALPPDLACHVGDGEAFLQRSADVYDAIVLDAYEGDRIPTHFCAAPFLALARERLAPARGCILANVHVQHDLDTTPDRLAASMASVWREVRVLDARGRPKRNAIVMAGAVAALEPPRLIVRPAISADEIGAEIELLAFRPFLGGR